MSNNSEETIKSLNSLFKEIYSDQLAALIPNANNLFSKMKQSIYTQEQWKQLRSSKLGDLIILNESENIK